MRTYLDEVADSFGTTGQPDDRDIAVALRAVEFDSADDESQTWVSADGTRAADLRVIGGRLVLEHVRFPSVC